MFKLSLVTDPEKVETLRIGESEILYTRATGDEVQQLMEDSVDLETGRHDGLAVSKELMRRHIRGWSGVVDAEGNDYEYEPDRVEQFVNCLGWQAQRDVDRAVLSSFREASEGKGDSKSGSSGTD